MNDILCNSKVVMEINDNDNYKIKNYINKGKHKKGYRIMIWYSYDVYEYNWLSYLTIKTFKVLHKKHYRIRNG